MEILVSLTVCCGAALYTNDYSGGLISTWSFLPTDAPDYPIGNGLNLATSTAILLSAIALIFFMKADNKRRDKIDVTAKLAGLDQKQVEDLDWKHPGFRWRQ